MIGSASRFVSPSPLEKRIMRASNRGREPLTYQTFWRMFAAFVVGITIASCAISAAITHQRRGVALGVVGVALVPFSFLILVGAIRAFRIAREDRHSRDN